MFPERPEYGSQRQRIFLKSVESQALTTRFFSATKTLGADTTAMVMSAVAPSRSCFARSVAVSSEYYYRMSGLGSVLVLAAKIAPRGYIIGGQVASKGVRPTQN